MIQARRPDIVVKDKKLGHTWIIDIAVPEDARVEDKKKVEKYCKRFSSGSGTESLLPLISS